MYNLLLSSKNDGSLSRTLKGTVALIVVVLISMGIDISEETILNAVENVVIFITAGYALYGALLKIYNKVTGKHI